jgi:ribosomal protein L16 Arg81 hydroxylase
VLRNSRERNDRFLLNKEALQSNLQLDSKICFKTFLQVLLYHQDLDVYPIYSHHGVAIDESVTYFIGFRAHHDRNFR